MDPKDPDVWRYASWVDRVGTLFGGDIAADLLGEPSVSDDPRGLCGELCYHFQPLEILPFCWNGGDGLHYGWAVLAPELDAEDHICVSFAPVDDWAVWLGDNTKEALENLLSGEMANWAKWGREQGLQSPAEDERWPAVCRALDLHPHIGSPQIGPGARSKRTIRPEVPLNWRYEPTGDGIGVLAEAAAFAPDIVHRPWDSDEHLSLTRWFLDDGYPGSALCVLKSLGGYDRPIVQMMREAYQQLGRALHVERAELWLRLNSA
ncbi:hypothetical protein [Actinomadura coerulea]|uniref:hypothetical protein n=1 Tax=Actinomadura coerulea TaxID=46159 RepID=UPI0034159AB4